MELNDLQKVIVETEEPKVIVIASAAAGKTAVLTERLKYLLKKLKESISNTVFAVMIRKDI